MMLRRKRRPTTVHVLLPVPDATSIVCDAPLEGARTTRNYAEGTCRACNARIRSRPILANALVMALRGTS